MNLPDITRDLSRAMPGLRGKLRADVPLAPLTWFRTGGAAQTAFWPEDAEDLATFLAGLDPAIPVMPLGLGSNLLVRDGGLEGIVIFLGPGFGALTIEHDVVSVGAAVPDVKLASAAANAGLAGFSFLRGIPGTIGGALRMNAGAFGGEVKDIFLSCEGIGRNGEIRRFDAEAIEFSYRHCGIDDVIFTRASLIGRPGDQEAIRTEMAEIAQARSTTQPVNTRTGGSTFKNPPGHKAWQLVDEAGCRGLVLGDAQVSELHCNFLINRGRASAADIEDLGEEVRRRVVDTSGVMLEWEIQRVGARLPV
ncbi:MAG: UDP-N-acetylmuramate dehydrogenase [Beijerinckiaceae bacterium]